MPDKNPHRVQSMFGAIAPVYDALNHVFSLNIDQRWRRFAVRKALRPTDRRVLDVACGTGDLTAALGRGAGSTRCLVVGADFCEPMLRVAHRKGIQPVLRADGLRLPFPDASFDVVTIAFGLRNMVDPQAGLREMARVLRPGGRLAVLEFTTPTNPLVRAGYLMYFRFILPTIGWIVSRTRAYFYLSNSVMEWPGPRKLAKRIQAAGFDRVAIHPLTFGIAALHLARRSREPVS